MTPERRLQEFQDALGSRTIPGLDGTRALAVLLVIASHFGFHQINGSLGVLIFFVLSGFLITWLMLGETERTGTVSLRQFYKRRTLRIFPAFYAFWLFGMAVYHFRGHPMEWEMAIAAFFYVSNYYVGLGGADSSLFGHTWSLSIEEQFYLLWPAAFLLGKRNLRRLSWILVGVVLAVWLHRTVLHFGFGVDQRYLYRAFDTRLDHLMVGCLMAVMLRRRALDRVVLAVTSRTWLPAVPLVALLAVQPLHSDPAFTFVVGYALEPLLVAVFLLQLIALSRTGIWRVFEHPVAQYLGRISYPLYLWQQLTLFTSKRLTAEFPVGVQFLFALAVTVAFASASYFIVEKPFLKLKDRGRKDRVPVQAKKAS